MKLGAAVAVVLGMTVTSVAAGSSVDGWSVTYEKAAFSGAVMPRASVVEGTSSGAGSSLSYECLTKGPAFLFALAPVTPARPITVLFKGSNGKVVPVEFMIGKGTVAAGLGGILKDANQADVAWKFGEWEGAFSSIGAPDALKAVDDACAKRRPR